VQRQYSGTAGKIENCQLAVHLVYATETAHAMLDTALYLPKSWCDDPERRAEAGVPEHIRFATKPQLAARMIEAAVAGGLPCRWVTGDEAYGGDPRLAARLRTLRLGYVLAVARSHQVTTGLGVFRADALAAGLPTSAWQRVSAGRGAKGYRYYDWSFTALPHATDSHDGYHWLLIRRNRTTGELAFYRCWSPEPVPLRTLVAVSGRRWKIEESLCATRRLVVSPTQLGGTREEVSGSEWLTRSRKVSGDKSMPGNQWPGPDVRGGALGDPRDMAKAELPEAQSPVDATSHPSERRLKPVPCSAAVMKHSRGNFRNAERCPARVFKEMSGPPKSRSDVRQGRTWDRLRDASPMATQVP
jgi:hypothetical protein